MNKHLEADSKEDMEPRRGSTGTNNVGELADVPEETLTPEQNRRLLIKTNSVVLTIMVWPRFWHSWTRLEHELNNDTEPNLVWTLTRHRMR